MEDKIVLSSNNRMSREYHDNLFKEIFRKEDSIKELLQFIGVNKKEEKIEIRIVEPVLVGNRQNDLSFLLNGIFYYFLEHQSTGNKNMPIRLLFYVCQALEHYIDGEDLYKKKEIEIPEVKCYTIFTGLCSKAPEQLETIQRLSDLYLSREKQEIDLELRVHCFHMEMTKEEVKQFLEEEKMPDRFRTMKNLVVQYAIFVNVVKYGIWKQSVTIDTQKAKEIVVETCELFLKKGYLTEFLTRKEVINMAVEQLSREEILLIEGREEGRIEGRAVGREEGRIEGRTEEREKMILRMYQRGMNISDIEDIIEMPVSEIKKLLDISKQTKHSTLSS